MCPITETIKSESFATQDDYQNICGIIYKLWAENQQYRKLLFGQKKERFIPNPTEQILFEGLAAGKKKTIATEVKAHTRHAEKKEKPVRQLLPGHLERRTEIIEPEAIKSNPDKYEKIGEEVSEQLEMTPAKFWVRQTIRPKYKNREDNTITCAGMPANIFAKYLAASSVIAYVLTAKYSDHLPLYRINKIFKRSGIEISESTMIGWIEAAAGYLETIYNRILAKIPETRLIQCDESPLPVLEQGNPKTHRGYMFVYILDKRYVIYDYRETRGREGPLIFLKDFKGIIQADAYGGYNEAVQIYNLIRIACMAHIRRKFYEAFDKGEKASEKALIIIRELYEIEREIRGCEEKIIRSARLERSMPILKSLKDWADDTKRTVLPQSLTGKAVVYFLNEYANMENYISHPEADIDNNLCERTIRPMTIGRKNYLFAGSHEAARRSAIVYSLSLTCRMYGMDQQAYYNRVFDLMAKQPDMNIDLLLPDRIQM